MSRLTYIKHSHFVFYDQKDGRRRGYAYAYYRCSCGTLKVICKKNVDCGHTKSCGCLRVENGHRMRKENLAYTGGRGGWSEEYKHLPSPIKGKIRIIEDGKARYVFESELYEIYWNG